MPASSPGVSDCSSTLIAVALGPADVHPRQHRGPVAALGAAGAGVDLEEGVVAVRLAVEQRLDLAPAPPGRAAPRSAASASATIAASPSVSPISISSTLSAQVALEALVAGERVGQHLPVAHQLLRRGRVVPEVGVLDAGVQLLEPVRAPSRGPCGG